MVTIVYSHPWDGSFCKYLCDETVRMLEDKGKEYQIIDLYADNFNPVLTKEDLSVYVEGGYTDPLVKKYQDILLKTTELVIIFPIWWSTSPAIFKGFLDKVFLKGATYEENASGFLQGKLTNIENVTVITTSAAPNFYLKYFAGNYVKKTLIGTVLKSVGIKKGRWFSCGDVKVEKKRTKFLEKFRQKF